MSLHRRIHVRVTGVVQGVGFRFFVCRVARNLGLVGYVRNCADGSVELEAEGEPSGVTALVDAVSTGPPGADVRDTFAQPRPVPGPESGFEIRW